MTYAIMKEAISPEVLEAEGITPSGEAAVGEDVGSPILCWELGEEDVQRLISRGYSCSTRVPVSDALTFIAVTLPDGSPARAGVDPVDIRVVDIVDWNGSAELRSYVAELAQKHVCEGLKLNARIRVPHGSRATPHEDEGTLAIHFYSSAGAEGEVITPHTMWGHQVSCTDRLRVGVWLDGFPLLSEEGDEIGAMTETNVFIYHDAVHESSPDQKKILTKIFELIEQSHKAGLKETDTEVVKRNYVKECSQRYKLRLQSAKRDRDNLKENMERAQRSLIDAIRGLKVADDEITRLEGGVKDGETALEAEFDRLLSMEKVVGVGWRGNRLTVDTDVLYCEHPSTGNLHEIGAFRLIIDARTGDVLFLNKTRKVHGYREGMNGPHLFPDGRACLGNYSETIPMLVAGYEWASVVDICIMFAESVNLDDAAGRHIERWPIHKTKAELAREATALEAAAAVAAE